MPKATRHITLKPAIQKLDVNGRYIGRPSAMGAVRMSQGKVVVNQDGTCTYVPPIEIPTTPAGMDEPSLADIIAMGIDVNGE